MPPLIFDDYGRPWDRDSFAFHEHFHGAWLADDPTGLIVWELGGIAVLLLRGAAIVHLNPSRVTAAALASLYRWLIGHSFERFCLAYRTSDRGVAHKIFGRGGAALRELEALIAHAREPQLPFAWLQDRLEHLQNVFAFAALFEHWRTSGGVFHEGAYGPLLSQFAQNRFIIFQPRSTTGDLKIVRAGEGLHIPDKKSHAGLAGTQLVNVADQAYGRWTSGIYHGVLEKREPRFDHIHATIHWPTGPVERRYWRLVLPCTGRDGRPLLLGVSCDPGPLDDLDGLDRKVA